MSEINVCPNPGFRISKRSQFLNAAIESYIKVISNREKKLYSSSERRENMYTCLKGNIRGFDINKGVWVVPEKGFYRFTVHAHYRTNYKKGQYLEGSTFTKVLIGEDIILGQTNIFDKTSQFYSSKASFSGLVQLDEKEEVIFSLFQINKQNQPAFATIEIVIDYLSKIDDTVYKNKYEGGICETKPKRITFDNERLQATRGILKAEYTDEGLFFKSIVDFLVGQDYDKKGKYKTKDLPVIPKFKEKGKTPAPDSKATGKKSTPKTGTLSSSGGSGFIPGKLPAISGVGAKSQKGKEKVAIQKPSSPNKKQLQKQKTATKRLSASGGSAGKSRGTITPTEAKKSTFKPNLRILTGNAALESYDTYAQSEGLPPISKLTLIMRDGKQLEFPATKFKKINLYGPSKGNRGFKIITNDPTISKYTGAPGVVSKIKVDYGRRSTEFTDFRIAAFKQSTRGT